MDYELHVSECADGTAVIWSYGAGVMTSFDTWANALAYWNLFGVGAP
jgi:hypothetical protein